MPAPKKSMRPKARPDDAEAIMALRRAERAAEREARESDSLIRKAEGGKMKMVKKGDKMVPDFAADGVGKMMYGGKMKKMRDGGMCRGMGAATKGGKYRMG